MPRRIEYTLGVLVHDFLQIVPHSRPVVHVLMQDMANVPAKLDWLSHSELDFCETLKIEKRRKDWLLGRWTAKVLIARIVTEQTGARPVPAQLLIHKAADGSPRVEVAADTGRPMTLTLSISHSHGLGAAAVVMEPDWSLGIDLELIAERHPAFAADYFTPQEQQQVARVTADQRLLAVNVIWSGKEAALKAVHLGLTADTRAVACQFGFDAAPADDWRPFAIIWDRSRIGKKAPPLQGYWQTAGRFVLTVASARALT